MKKRFVEGQIIGLLREVDAGLAVKVLWWRHSLSKLVLFVMQSIRRHEHVGCQKVEETGIGENPGKEPAGRIPALERSYQGSLKEKVVKVPSRRELVRAMVDRELSQRRVLRVLGMSASSYRYQPSDRDEVLRQKIIDLAH